MQPFVSPRRLLSTKTSGRQAGFCYRVSIVKHRCQALEVSVAKLALLVDGVAVKQFDLTSGEVTIGRRSDNDIHIDDLAVSGRHARIVVLPDPYLEDVMRCELHDCGSTNGTFLNEVQITKPTILRHGDVIRIGFQRFKFIDEKAPDLERTAVMLPDED
ncbi:MAG: FHA domain-containing protein [Gammaproteobacteria bacterium]|nr:MAG: FHA domain-containing protein [Gammaproteobacteria bacterium]